MQGWMTLMGHNTETIDIYVCSKERHITLLLLLEPAKKTPLVVSTHCTKLGKIHLGVLQKSIRLHKS